MSWFRWLSVTKSPAKGNPVPESSGLSRMEATRPLVPSGGRPARDAHANGGNAQPANRKTERMARRELLYLVVRDSMVRSGVLTASYKFKVLSLDARGRQFLVMVDLARDCGGQTDALAEIEALIAQGAKTRYDIIVTAVYWRMNEHVAVGAAAIRTPRATHSQPAELDSTPMPQQAALLPQAVALPLAGALPPVATPAPALQAAHPVPLPPALAPRGTPRYEPIEADEVAAFKQALAAGIARPSIAMPAPVRARAGASLVAATALAGASASAKTFDGSGKHGPQSYTLLTGFEDTEMSDDEQRMPALSGTQYGDLN